MTGWPDIERPLCDHLNAGTTFTWTVEGNHLGDRVPLGIVQCVGGGNDLSLEDTPNVEVTLIAATRPAIRSMAREAVAVFRALNPGGINDSVYVDEARQLYGFVIDPDAGTATYRVATATFTLTLRPQVETLP